MANLRKARKALAAYDKRKNDQLRELIKNMPAVELYVQTHRPVWNTRRSPATTKKPVMC